MTVFDFMLLPFTAFFDFIFSNVSSYFFVMVMMFLVLYHCIVIPIWGFLKINN